MRSLAGKVAVVTGGASGIGLALADRLLREGAKVVIADIDGGALDAALSTLDGEAAGVRAVEADVTSPTSMGDLREAALASFGRVDVACLNAGVITTGTILETTPESWRWLVDVNLMGVVNGVVAFAPGLVDQGEGHLLLTASAAGVMNAPGLGAYGTTKHAVVGLAANLGEELAPAGVGVTVLCPGMVRTPLYEGYRRRSEDLRSEVHPAEETIRFYERLVAEAPGPETVAETAVRGILEDRLFVLLGDDIGGLATRRIRELQAALPPR